MKRRTAIQSIGLVTTHALFPSILTSFLAGCANGSKATPDPEPTFFTEQEMESLKEVIDLILPETNTRSASAVGTHRFMDEVFVKCLPLEQQKMISEGFTAFLPKFQSTENKLDLLTQIDQQAFSGNEAHSWFIPVKQYAMIGFFTSQEGTTKASNYVPVPGDYQGDIPADENTLNYGLTSQHYYI